jgi:hypothetical protein
MSAGIPGRVAQLGQVGRPGQAPRCGIAVVLATAM